MASRKINQFFLVVVFFVVGCAPSIAGSAETRNKPTVEPIPQAIVGEPSDALLQDAQAYAKDYGIDVEEALRRLSLQDTIGILNARLQSEQRETFAGLWIEHEPSFRLITAFTHNGEETLAPYISGTPLVDIVEVRTAEVPYEELQVLQAEINRLLGPLDTPFSTGINIQENLVELYIKDLAAFDASIQEHDIQLPPRVNIVTIYEPLGDDDERSTDATFWLPAPIPFFPFS